MKYFNEYIFSSSRFICLLGSFFFFIGLQARCEVCPCLQVVHPAIFVGRKKVVAAKKAACEMKALFAQPVVTVVTAFFDVKCSCHSKLFTKEDSKELITSNARGKECPLQKCTHRTP